MQTHTQVIMTDYEINVPCQCVGQDGLDHTIVTNTPKSYRVISQRYSHSDRMSTGDGVFPQPPRARLLELTLSRALLATVAEGRRECELCAGWQSFQLEVTYIMPTHVSLSHDHVQLHRDRVCYPTMGLDGKLGIFGEWRYDSHKWYLYLN